MHRDRDSFNNFPGREMTTKRRITIFEDPRDEFNGPPFSNNNGFYDGGNYMTRSEVSRRFDYGPNSERTPLRIRYRGARH